jgi:hypothetical protein
MTLPESIAEDQLHSAARSYIELGWPVFPVHTVHEGRCTCGRDDCADVAKHPLTPNGHKDASTDGETINRWWTEAPPANVAIRTGHDGPLVVDVDGEEGLAALADLEARHGPLPRTPTARTGGGGKHYFFASPHGLIIKNRVKIQGLPIDTRGEGGYVVAPPSLHSSGNRYEWEIAPKDAPLAPAPQWLLDSVTNGAAGPDGRDQPTGNGKLRLRVRADHIETAPGASEGNRHAQALRLVGAALARGEPADDVEAHAVDWAARCNPPFPEPEIRRIVRDLVEKHDAGDGKREQPAIALSKWERPIPLDENERPGFPTRNLADWQRRKVEGVAQARQTPVDLPALLALAVTGAVCAREVIVRIKEHYTEPLNLYVVIGLGSANRKSGVFRDCYGPLSEYERQAVKDLSPQIAASSARKAINEARLAKLQSEAAKADAESREGLAQQAEALARAIAETKIPVSPRLLAQDATPEKIKSMLHEHGGRLMLASPEGDLFAAMERYGKSGGPNIGVYLDAHCGDDIRVDRVGRPTEFVRNPTLTLALTVQPEVIQGLADKPGLRGQGFLVRPAWSLPKSLVGRRDPNPPPVPAGVHETYRQKLHALLKLCPGRASAEDYDPHDLRLSSEADRLRLEFEGWLEPQLDPTAELAHVWGWSS